MSKTVIRYAGGKTRAVNKITPFVEPYEKIVSPFIGGGSLEVHWACNLDKKVIGYDVFNMLVNFWSHLLCTPDKLADKLSEITPTKEEYKRVKELLMCLPETQDMLKDWNTDYYKRDEVIDVDDLTKSAWYYFNHNTSYGPGYLGWGSSVYLQQDKWDKMVQKIRDFKCDNLSVYQLPFDESIRKHKKDFLYLDPPYYLEKDSDNKMHSGLYPMKNIDVHHSGFDHELLRDLLLEHEGDFVLSYNNCETIREYYKDFEQYFPEWSYSLGNGETKIGKNRKDGNGDNVKESHEILIVKRSVR
jgi:DNA adenine methylase